MLAGVEIRRDLGPLPSKFGEDPQTVKTKARTQVALENVGLFQLLIC